MKLKLNPWLKSWRPLASASQGWLTRTCIQSDASRLFTKHTYSLRRLPGAFAWVLGFLASTHSPLGIWRVQDYPTRQAKGDEWKQSTKKEDFYEDPLVIWVSTVPEGLQDGLHYLERPKVTFLVFKAIQITAGHWRRVLPPTSRLAFLFSTARLGLDLTHVRLLSPGGNQLMMLKTGDSGQRCGCII